VFRDPGQILIIRDCPGDSGTVEAYVSMHVSLNNLISVLELFVHSGIRKYIAGAELIEVNWGMGGLPIPPEL